MLKYAVINADPKTRAGEILALLNPTLVHVWDEDGVVIIRGPHFMVYVMRADKIPNKLEGERYHRVVIEQSIPYSDYSEFIVPSISHISISGMSNVEGSELDGVAANFEKSEEM